MVSRGRSDGWRKINHSEDRNPRFTACHAQLIAKGCGGMPVMCFSCNPGAVPVVWLFALLVRQWEESGGHGRRAGSRCERVEDS